MSGPWDQPRHRVLVTGGSGFIGTNLIEQLLQVGCTVVNVSRRAPRCLEQAHLFREVDILNLHALMRAFDAFEPDAVVHLAAETGFMRHPNRRGYEINTRGTANVIQAVAAHRCVTRCLFASSNVVCRNEWGTLSRDGGPPRGLYGESKVIAERMIREDITMTCAWCIVRPCYVWGPWFDAPFKDFSCRLPASAISTWGHLTRVNAWAT